MMTTDPSERQRWLQVLAESPPDRLATLAEPVLSGLAFDWLRRPETGLVMAQGRIGNSGARFNLAEVTVTRCVVRSAWRTAGVGYVIGRRPAHAGRVARIDALLQVPDWAERVESVVVRPLAQALAERDAHDAASAASSRVDFYTLAPEGAA